MNGFLLQVASVVFALNLSTGALAEHVDPVPCDCVACGCDSGDCSACDCECARDGECACGEESAENACQSYRE